MEKKSFKWEGNKKIGRRTATLALALTLLVGILPGTVPSLAAAQVKEVLPYTDFSQELPSYQTDGGVWVPDTSSTSVRNGTLQIEAYSNVGPSFVFKYLDDLYKDSNYHNSVKTYSEKWRTYRHVFKTRMTLSQTNGAADAWASIVANSNQAAQSADMNTSGTKDVLLLLKESAAGPGYYQVLLHTDGKRDYDGSKSNSDPSSYTVPDGYSQIPVGQYVSVAIVMYHQSGQDYVEFYLDGKRAAEPVAFYMDSQYQNGLADSTMIRFRTVRGSGAQSIIVNYDDMAYTAIPNAESPTWEFKKVTREGDSVVVEFTGDLSESIKSGLTLEGSEISADRVTILPDQRSIRIAGITGSDFALGLKAGIPDLFGAVSTGQETYSYQGSSSRTEILEYQDFSSDTGAITGQGMAISGGVLTGTANNNMASGTVNLTAFRDAMTSGNPYQLLVTARTKNVPTAGQSGTVEIGLVKDTTTYSRLISHYYDQASDTYQAKYNDTNVGNGAVPTVALEISNQEAQDWLDWVITIQGTGTSATATYYCNGQKLGTGGFPIQVEEANAIRFSVQTYANKVPGCTGSFDDAFAYLVTGDPAGLTGTLETTETVNDQSLIVRFSAPVVSERISATVNGIQTENGRLTLAPDKCTLTIAPPKAGWGYGQSLEVKVLGTDYFGISGEISGIVTVQEQPTYNYTDKTSIIGLQTFDSITSSQWLVNGGTVSGGLLTLTESTATNAVKRSVAYPEALKNAIADKTPYRLLIRGQVGIQEMLAGTSSHKYIELGLASGGESSSSLIRMFHVFGSDESDIQAAYSNSPSANSYPANKVKDLAVGEMAEVVIVVDAKGGEQAGEGNVTYYVDGMQAASGVPVSGLDKADQVRIMAQNYVTGQLDNFEAYAILGGGVPHFICETVAPESLGVSDDLVLTFSNDFPGEKWKDEGLFLNGEAIPTARISRDGVRGLRIKAPEGGYDSLKEYTLTWNPIVAKDVFGTPLETEFFTFRTGGSAITAQMSQPNVQGTKVTATARIRNVSGQPISLYVIAAEYSGSPENPMIEQVKLIPQNNLASQDSWVEIPVEIEMFRDVNSLKLMIWTQDLVPVLEIPVVYSAN